MYEIKDKVIMVTGGAAGIGAAGVKSFMEEGAKKVIILDIDEDNGLILQNKMNEKHGDGKAEFKNCDVTDEKQLFKAFDDVMEANGRVDIVVNNAGFANESTPEIIRKQVELNYTAVVQGTYKAINVMRKDSGGVGGVIVNVSSVAALSQMCPGSFTYMGLKSAIMQFSNCVGKKYYYSKTGVKVITVCFGVTDTNLLHYTKGKSFDKSLNAEIDNLIDNHSHMQSVEDAARGLITAIKHGDSGSTWLVNNSKPAVDITPVVKEAYGLLSKTWGFKN